MTCQLPCCPGRWQVAWSSCLSQEPEALTESWIFFSLIFMSVPHTPIHLI